MTFKRDCNCRHCYKARQELQEINATLHNSDATELVTDRPILLLHFPLYRPNENLCTETDVTLSLLARK